MNEEERIVSSLGMYIDVIFLSENEVMRVELRIEMNYPSSLICYTCNLNDLRRKITIYYTNGIILNGFVD